jgi:hypothetical protein
MLTNYDYVVDRESKFGTIHFDYIDDSRLVNYKRTALLVFRIESWFDNNGYGFRRGFMIPENSKHAVEHYKSLLMDDITLSFNEALFLLLGLDVLSLALSQFVNMDLINYKKSLDSSNMVENIFINTTEFNELIRGNLINNRIKSKELVNLGKKCGFIGKLDNQKIAINTVKEMQSSNEHTRKPETVRRQNLITDKAEKLLKENPNLRKGTLAGYISDWIEENEDISLTPGAIEREYLKNYQALKLKARKDKDL